MHTHFHMISVLGQACSLGVLRSLSITPNVTPEPGLPVCQTMLLDSGVVATQQRSRLLPMQSVHMFGVSMDAQARALLNVCRQNVCACALVGMSQCFSRQFMSPVHACIHFHTTDIVVDMAIAVCLCSHIYISARTSARAHPNGCTAFVCRPSDGCAADVGSRGRDGPAGGPPARAAAAPAGAPDGVAGAPPADAPAGHLPAPRRWGSLSKQIRLACWCRFRVHHASTSWGRHEMLLAVMVVQFADCIAGTRGCRLCP